MTVNINRHPGRCRVDERRDGRRVQRVSRPADLRGLHEPGQLDRRLGRLRLLHGRRAAGLPGCVQGAGEHQQQLAARAAGEGARATARRLRQRLQDPARHHRQLRQVASAHGRRRADLLRHARHHQSHLQVSTRYFLSTVSLVIFTRSAAFAFSISSNPFARGAAFNI